MFCPKCGSQIPDSSKFCPTCGATLDNATAATGSPSKPRTKEGGSKKKIWGVVGAILIILLGKVLITVTRNVTNTSTAPQSPAIEQTDSQATPGLSDYYDLDAYESAAMGAFGDTFALSGCEASVADSQLRLKLVSSVDSTDPQAQELAALYSQTFLTDENIQGDVSLIRNDEAKTGVSGITYHLTLYYADGAVCGDYVSSDSGLVDYSLAYQG